MYRIYQTMRHGYPTIRTVIINQAGGCTRDELDRECERIARSRSAKDFGGSPLDWDCVSFLVAYMIRDACKTIVEHINAAERATWDAAERATWNATWGAARARQNRRLARMLHAAIRSHGDV